MRSKISNLIKQLENIFKESKKRKNYIDYLEKQLAFFQNKIHKLNDKILDLYRSKGSLLCNKNSYDTIDLKNHSFNTVMAQQQISYTIFF